MGRLIRDFPFLEYVFITIGAAIMALGIGIFLVDAQVVPGGVSGLSMALHYFSDNKLPVGLMMWVLNIPLYIWGFRELGKRFGVRTFYGFTANSFFIDFFRGDVPGLGFIHLQKSATVMDLQKHDFLFLILVGAVLLGIGLGIIFKFKGTTAGSDILAAILQKRYGIKPGQAIMLIDFFVISFAGFIIHFKHLAIARPAMSLTLYAFFLLFVSSKLVDIILDGFDYARAAYIISDKSDQLSKAIIQQLSRGATALKARGLYKNIDREVLMTVVTRKEIGELTELIEDIDPDAFVIISDVHEVLGKGFRRRI
ncbi:MAG: YitT family protein [Calditrichia bacterium]